MVFWYWFCLGRFRDLQNREKPSHLVSCNKVKSHIRYSKFQNPTARPSAHHFFFKHLSLLWGPHFFYLEKSYILKSLSFKLMNSAISIMPLLKIFKQKDFLWWRGVRGEGLWSSSSSNAKIFWGYILCWLLNSCDC